MLKPLLSRHYSVWVDPPDDAGDETLHIVSEQRTLKLKGFAFREFRDRVIPLLDGSSTVDEIAEATSDVFSRNDLVASLTVLEEHGIVVEGGDAVSDDRRAPQLNLLRELAPEADPQSRLARSRVAVLGLGGFGTSTALALAAAGIGTVRCVDALLVAAADVYLGPALGTSRVGAGRAASAAALIADAAPDVAVEIADGSLDSDEAVAAVIEGCDLVVCCLDAAQSNTIYKLNRACLAAEQSWLIGAPSGAEVVVGPLFVPFRSACFMCYRMRVIACAGNPEDAFRYERRLDGAKRDESGQRANLVFGAGVAANLLALEAVKHLSGVLDSALVGRILTVRMTDLAIERHTVLRKPWCPACFPSPS